MKIGKLQSDFKSQSDHSGWLCSCGYWIALKYCIFGINSMKNPVKSMFSIWSLLERIDFSMLTDIWM